MGQVTLMSGRERRRHWSGEDRARILAAISAPDAVVAEIARREDICTSPVHKWRREARKSSSQVQFAPVVVEAASLPAPAPANVEKSGVIVVEVDDARVRIHAEASAALVAVTLKALRA
ncbi:MAG TPA: transposase [Roseiarcus sp.]|nr:transposase [Roseiarcus sp.]